MRKAACSMRQPLCSSGEPLIRVRQPDECRGEAFCSIGATANCPCKAPSFAAKALRFTGKLKSHSRKPFCSARKASRLAPQGFDPCARSTKPCAQGRKACI